MTGKLKAAAFLFAAIVLASPLAAQEESDGFQFGFSLGIGTATFQEGSDTVTYQKLVLSPDFAFGKFGIGLDLTLNFTFTGPPSGSDFYVRREDWVPSGDDEFLDVYLPKFKYIRWGQKGDPLYAKLGTIEDMTLGDGFIMLGYSNSLFLPERRIFGLNLDVDGSLFGVPIVGFESVLGNLARFDVMAIRPYVRPLAGTAVPILQNLQVGATLAADTNPGLYKGVSADPILVYGVDLQLPLLATPAVKLATFADLASVDSRSLGGMVGFGGRLVGFLLYGAQLRVLGEDFIPSYFDAAYDLFRYDKYQLVQAGTGNSAFVGWLGTLGFSVFQDALLFSATLEGPFSRPDPGDPGNYLNYPHLLAVFRVNEGLIPNVSLLASYDKRLIRTWDDLVSPEDAVIQTKLNYRVGAAVLSFTYNLRYVPDPAPGEDSWEVTSGLESSIQLF